MLMPTTYTLVRVAGATNTPSINPPMACFKAPLAPTPHACVATRNNIRSHSAAHWYICHVAPCLTFTNNSHCTSYLAHHRSCSHVSWTWPAHFAWSGERDVDGSACSGTHRREDQSMFVGGALTHTSRGLIHSTLIRGDMSCDWT
jgi:hypothetical protein